MNIFISKQGRQLGPYTHEQLQRMLGAGSVAPNDWAWYEGAADWMPLHNVPGYVAVPVAREDIYDYYTPPRPVLVWIISIYYVLGAVFGLFILVSTPFFISLKHSTPGMHDYLAHQTAVEYITPLLSMACTLTGAVFLFRMRRQALYWFVGGLVVLVFQFGYQILFHNAFVAAADISQRLLVTTIISVLVSFSMRLAVVGYVWYLYHTRVLR